MPTRLLDQLKELRELQAKGLTSTMELRCREIVNNANPGTFILLLITYIRLGKVSREIEDTLMRIYIRKNIDKVLKKLGGVVNGPEDIANLEDLEDLDNLEGFEDI